ncbi:MAG TPA: hypothetical protein VGH89_33285, partial [Pseudonocardia sp.]
MGHDPEPPTPPPPLRGAFTPGAKFDELGPLPEAIAAKFASGVGALEVPEEAAPPPLEPLPAAADAAHTPTVPPPARLTPPPSVPAPPLATTVQPPAALVPPPSVP